MTDNQVQEIAAAGFIVTKAWTIVEAVSGSVAAKERKGFARLLGKMETGDVLIVTKLDRLGRNAMDVRATVEQLKAAGVRVHCLALGGVDLTSPAGKMTMQLYPCSYCVETINHEKPGLHLEASPAHHQKRPARTGKKRPLGMNYRGRRLPLLA